MKIALDKARSRALLTEAHARLVVMNSPVFVRDDAKVKRLEAELALTKAALAKAHRAEALAKATIYAGSPSYADSQPMPGMTPIVALAGRSIHRPIGTAKRRWWQLWE